MAVAGQVSVKFTADVAEYTKATEKVTRANKSVENAAEGLLTKLKKQKEGLEKSGFNTLFETLKGGGALVGVTYAVDTIGRATHAAAELNAQFIEGKVSSREMFDEIAKGIPVIGKFYGIGLDIRELITGEKAYTQVMLDRAKAQDDATAAQGRYLEVTKDIDRAIEDAGRRLRGGDGLADKIGDVWTTQARKVEDLSKTLKSYQDQIDDVGKRREEAINKLNNLQNIKPSAAQSLATGVGNMGPSPALTADIANTQKAIDKLTDKQKELQAKKASLEKMDRNTFGRELFTDVAKIAGERLGAQGDAVAAAAQKAVDSYLSSIRQMSDETRQLLEGAQTPWDNYLATLSRLDLELRQGAISQDQYALAATQAAKTIQTNFAEAYTKAGQAAKDAADVVERAAIDRLSAEGRAGNEQAARAAQALAVEREIAQKREELEKVRNSSGADLAVRRAAQAELDALPGLKQSLLAANQDTIAHPSATPQLHANYSTNDNNPLLNQAVQQTELLKQLVAKKTPFKVMSIGN